MSLYNDATMIFLGQAAAGGVSGKLHTVKPLEKLGEELVTNGSFTDRGPGTGGLVANTSEDTQNGWTHHGSDSTAVVKIVDGVLKLINDSSTTVNKAYATNGSDSANILTQGKKYKLSYRVVYNDNVESGGFRYYNGSAYTNASPDIGKHSIIFEQVSTQLFILQLSTASSEIHIDDVSIKEVEQEADPFFFQRLSDYGATRVGHDGFIKKVRENLITNSSEFDNSDWDLASGYTLTSGQSGYDLTSNAYKLEATADGTRNLHQNITIEGLVTFSIFAKKGTTDFMRLSLTEDDENGDAHNSRVWFNLDTATVGTAPVGDAYVTSSIEKIPKGDNWNGWCRCSVTFNVPSDHDATEIAIWATEAMGTAQVDNGDNIYIQDAQLEKGMVATPYIKNFDSTRVIGVKENEPRFDYYDTTTPRLLTEPKRTNLVKITEGIPEAKSNVTLTYNHGVSPDGRKNSLKVQKSGTNENDRIKVMDASAITLVSGVKYTISAFVKNIDCVGTTTLACRVAGQTNFRQGFGWASGSAGADIAVDDDHGGSGTRTNKFAEDYGNGWWRIGFTFTPDGTAGSFEIDIDRDGDSDDDTTSIETWGWQLEQTILNTGSFGASYVSSYIPNFGASAGATRNTEVMRIEQIQEKGLITNEQGTVLVDYDQSCTTAVHWDVRGPSGHVQYSLRMHTSTTSAFQFQYKSPDTGQVHIKTFSSLTGDRRKGAISWNRDTIIVSANGSSFTTSIPSDIAENLNRFQRANNSSTMTNPRSILIFDKQLSESELNELTTI